MDNTIHRFLDLSRFQNLKNNLPSQTTINDLIGALSEFMECVRYLNTRRSKTSLILDNEAAVQDALYLMIRPWVRDLIPESPTEKIANRYSIKDFLIPSLEAIIEVKYIRDESHGKNIVKEINDDIETYRYHHSCTKLIFFIYDPDALIPDRLQLENHINGPRIYSQKTIECFSVIRP